MPSGTPRKQALRRQLRKGKKQDQLELEKSNEEEQIDTFNKLCDILLPQNLAAFVKPQVGVHGQSITQRRYPQEYKQFSLTLFFFVSNGVSLLTNHFSITYC